MDKEHHKLWLILCGKEVKNAAVNDKKKINNVQMIKGNQAERNYCLFGSLVTYQCGEAVGEMSEP